MSRNVRTRPPRTESLDQFLDRLRKAKVYGKKEREASVALLNALEVDIAKDESRQRVLARRRHSRERRPTRIDPTTMKKN